MLDFIGKIIDPDHGDITMDVARDLARMREADDAALHTEAEARQTLIAAAAGQEGRTLSFGHQVAQIDARVYDYWRRREGPEFWRSELKYMTKRHPELRVVARPENATVRVSAAAKRVVGRRGRWAA